MTTIKILFATSYYTTILALLRSQIDQGIDEKKQGEISALAFFGQIIFMVDQVANSKAESLIQSEFTDKQILNLGFLPIVKMACV